MPSIYSGLVAINGNLLASVDLETTGRRPGHHEIIQIAVVPLNSDIRPLEGVRPFYHNIRPLHPERADGKATQVHGIKIEDLILHAPHPGKVADLLREWWERLDLPAGKTLVPLAHNWAFESAFLTAWLGIDEKQTLFHSHARDAFLLALSLTHRAAFAGEKPPCNKVGLGSLCKHFHVTNETPHDALSDALAEAEVYRAMVTMDIY